MKRDNTAWGPTPAASLQWREGAEPFSTAFKDIYYSRENGLAESRHVFLAGNDLPARWQDQGQDTHFCIAETGFGTGLNFLQTWQAWRERRGTSRRLHYIAIEKHPLDRQQLTQALQAWPELADLATQLLEAWPGRLPGQHRLNLDAGCVVLDLWWEDASAALNDLASHGQCVDAWYLDGFAPARNASMWLPEIFDCMAAMSRPGATVATFTAASAVRRGLQNAGFDMRKVPGFGRKRESLVGKIATLRSHLSARVTPWDLSASAPERPESALIIGAGLAGATLARALAERGVAVAVLDKGDIAGAASGNEQGVLYTRLSRRHSALTDFALQSFRYSATFYRQLLGTGELQEPFGGQLCGSFHQHSDVEELQLMRERLQALPELASVLGTEEAARYLGVTPAQPGYWYPDSGWLSPPAVCRALLTTPGIEVIERCGELSLHHDSGQWLARNAGGSDVLAADVAIVCAGTSSTGLAGLDWLPLQAIRGQTSHLPASPASSELKAALCHTGYISPAVQGRHCIGASFKLQDQETTVRQQEHVENIEKLLAALPQWRDAMADMNFDELDGRVGFRCASPDYLPIAGAVPDRSGFLQDYASLRKNARQLIAQRGKYVPGLFVNTAHGSRGLTSAPLCAQVLSAAICGEAPPLSRELLRALSPARFLIRDLSRNRI